MVMKKKYYKPKRSKSNPRTCRLAISVTPEEKQKLEEKASSVDLKVSEYLHHKIMHNKLKVITPQFRMDLSSLMSISFSLSQIKKEAETHNFLNKEELDKISECLDLIYKILGDELCPQKRDKSSSSDLNECME